jgi:glycosyltransferase involved in cell wall biosynthesis
MTADAVGGVWTYATSLARELCGQGAEITLVTLGPPPRRSQLREVADIEGLNLHSTHLALEWMDPEGRDLPRALTELAAIERQVRPDIVHLNGFREAIRDWKAPVVIVAHSCVRSWWLACRGEEPTEPRWHQYIANVREGLDYADSWVAPTRACRDSIQSLYAPPALGRVIWNGIGGVAVPPPFKSPRDKQPFILAAGRLWDEAKNVAMLARIAKRLPWPTQVAGPTAAGGDAASVPLPDVELLGELPLSMLREEMRRAAIFVAPALYEPFGLSILEAAHAGCALVLSDIPSLRELWDGAAAFVEPGDDAALLDALLHLIQDKEKRLTLQLSAAQHARRYPLSAMADSYAKLYDELTASMSSRTVQHSYSGVAP